MAEIASEAVGREVSVHTPREELAGIPARARRRGARVVGCGPLSGRAVRDAGRRVPLGCDVRDRVPRRSVTAPRRHRRDLEVTERFESYAAGRELSNGFSELIDPVEQRERFEDQARLAAAGEDETMPIDEDYIMALEWGLLPRPAWVWGWTASR